MLSSRVLTAWFRASETEPYSILMCYTRLYVSPGLEIPTQNGRALGRTSGGHGGVKSGGQSNKVLVRCPAREPGKSQETSLLCLSSRDAMGPLWHRLSSRVSPRFVFVAMVFVCISSPGMKLTNKIKQPQVVRCSFTSWPKLVHARL